ncbi:TcdA/TcdB pore-forming domain-containing protein [Arsenophonus sp. aPb]|uniref:TcdA/TcdB pore-forming domain-containing protein n=1 Tax=Arsenophonus sp. aPb TaxID=3041619 RepID=UPI0024693DC8|nr:TcdA/TcdB pore-forming domain-containing protein [Arsenophonus sp. aPb]WGL97611.1 TcdA/TcdB pore-forming domain-containing protein [Arsenophonus sp. aPb]
MDLSPALWSLIAQWRDWASEPNIDPSEQRETALNRVFDCIIKKDPYLDLSHLSLTSLPTLPEWLITLDIHNNQLTTLPANLPKTLTHLDAGKNQLTSLPEHLPETLIEIRVDHNKLTRLPDNLPKNLSMLNADHNQLSSLPEHLPDGLSVLDVSDNQLTTIPHNLPLSLTILSVNKNNLASLSDNLPDNLFYLDASDNPLTALPNKLPFKLEKLVVNNAFLTALPNTLPDELYHLSVSNNQITALPAKLPSKLQALTIDINQLSVLPNQLPALLRMLNVASNKLTCLPEVLPEELIVLDVSHNQLKALPKILPKNLLTLLANDNQLASLPFLPRDLNIVKVFGNQLKNIPDELPPWLTVLDIGDNQLTAIQGALPVELELLNVSRNQLKKLPDHLPDSLVEIDASYNELVLLPDKLPAALNRLLIVGNQLTWLGNNLPRGLTQLDVKRNQLKALPEDLPDEITELDISHNQLRVFPNHIPTSLEILDASYNKFISLPAHLPPSLQYLVAHHNQLNLLPDPLPFNLKILIVNNNELTQLPEVMPVFLQQIVVHNNQLTELPHFFEDLSYLDASYNQLTEFPAHFPSDVVTLILHNNQLRVLPAHLFQELIFLDVHNNQIAALPAHLPLLLEYSDFSGNPLDSIPTRFPLQLQQWRDDEHSIDISEEELLHWVHDKYISADEYHGRNIAVERINACINDNNSKSLDLSGLHLTRLPAHLPASITELRINNNQLAVLPTSLPANLKYLYAADNQLNALPGNLPNSLIYLDVSGNKLTALPNTLPIMLQHFDGHNNLLTYLPTNLPNILITLDVSHNQLIFLPNNLSNKLKKLDISDNQLTALPDSLPNQLGHLNVSYNQLGIMPGSLSNELKYLDVSHNRLTTLSNHLSDKLRYLNVSDNELTVLPPNLPAKLKYLNVSSNQLKELPAHFPNKLLFLDIDNNPLTSDQAAISIAAIESKQTAQLSKLFRPIYELIPEWFKWLDQAPTKEAKAREIAVHRMIDCLCLQERSLDLSNLNLTSLPAHLPYNLISLHVNDNQLAVLPAELPSTIQKLYAYNNQLTSLPVSLPERLILLDVNHNQLMALGNNLPTTLLGIDISSNQLIRLPDNFPAGLLLLNANNNQLTYLPDSLPTSLTHLFVRNNELKTLTNYLPNSLIRIDVSNNQLTALPDHIPDKLIRFNFTGNQLSAESIHLPINLRLTGSSRDFVSLNFDRKVSDWQLPTVSFQHEGESSRFDGQLIIQLEDELLVREAASKLLKKHPQISVLVQLDSEGNSFTVHGNIEHLRQQTKQRWQLVGHGRSLPDGEYVSLAWREAKSLALQLKQLATDLQITISPKHINLVGCSLADDQQQISYVKQFAVALDETIRPYSVSAYSSKLMVNNEGRKRLIETGNKTTLFFNHEKNDWHIEKVAGKTVNNLAKSAIEPATLAAPARLESISYKLMSFIKQAEQFQSIMSQFYHYHRLSLQKWVPLFTSLSKSKMQPGSYDLQFIHNETHQVKKLITNNKHIIDFINKFNQYLEMIIKVYYYNGKTLVLRGNMTDVDNVHGLNAAFLLKELIPWFANKHRLGVVDNELSETLSMALNIHTYLNLTQIVHGTVEDTLRLVNLYQMAAYQGQQATKGLLSPLFYGSYVLAGVFNIASIVLDSIELAHAQNDLQRVVFSAQLGVDITNLVVFGIGIGASMLGATTVATFTGALAVPLAGVGIGVTALAEAFGKVTHNVQIVGNYFADIDLAYQEGGYRRITKKITDSDAVITIMQPIPGAVITELDLRHNTLTYDSQYLYRNDPTYSSGSGHSNYFLFWPNRGVNRDKSQAINIRQGLGYQSSQSNFKPGDDVLILPGTPITYLDYAYMILPFVTTRDDRGFALLRKLEEDGRFDFDFYAFPGERAIYRLIPNYVATPIKVILDDRDRNLVLPTLPDEFQHYISYQLIGGEGEYRISLARGVSITLLSNHANTCWLLDARYLELGTNMQVSEEGNYLYIDNVIVTLPKNASRITVINKQGTFVFDENSQQMHIIHMDAMHFNNSDSLDEYLKMLANIQDHPTPFVIIDHYQPDNAVGPVGRAYYETARSRIIYTNRPDAAEFLSQAILAKVDGDKAWFYRDTVIWQVEISTGQLLRQYLPFSFPIVNDADIRSYTIQGNDQLLFVIEQNGMRCVYTVEDAALNLVAINGSKTLLDLLNRLKQLVDFAGQNKKSELLLSEHNQFGTSPNLDTDHLDKLISSAAFIPSRLAKIVYLSGYNDGQEQHYWLITEDPYAQNMIRLNLVTQSESDVLPHTDVVIANQAQSSASLAEFILVATTTGESTGYYFYHPQTHALYFQPDNGLSNSQAQLVANNIRSLFPINNKLFCQREDGIFSLLDNQGKNILIGISQDWLRQHNDNVILDLHKLINGMPDSADYIMLQGLQDRDGNPIRGWYDSKAGRIVQAGSSLDANHDLVYLGLSEDRQEALIYDNDEQQQYRFLQPANVTLTPTENGLLISDIPTDPLWAAFA